MQNSAKKWWIVGGIVAVIIVVMQVNRSSYQIENGSTVDPSQGPENAVMVIREYSDIQCPACRAAQKPLHDFAEKHKDLVRVEFNDFPLPIHRNAKPAAYAANCAIDQNKFWELLDMMYDNQSEWENLGNPDGKFIEYAGSLGLDTAKFESCVDARAYKVAVDEDIKEGLAAGINSTPTFFVNGERVVGGIDLSTWEEMLSKLTSSRAPLK